MLCQKVVIFVIKVKTRRVESSSIVLRDLKSTVLQFQEQLCNRKRTTTALLEVQLQVVLSFDLVFLG